MDLLRNGLLLLGCGVVGTWTTRTQLPSVESATLVGGAALSATLVLALLRARSHFTAVPR